MDKKLEVWEGVHYMIIVDYANSGLPSTAAAAAGDPTFCSIALKQHRGQC